MLTINKKIAFEIVKYCFERLNVVYVRLSKKHCQMYMKNAYYRCVKAL